MSQQKEPQKPDTKFGSGDCKNMPPSQKYQEENNNDIERLSKDFSEMGCIVDTAKIQPNICVETCVHDDRTDDSSEEQVHNHNDEDAYSDEFEEESDHERDMKKPSVSSSRSQNSGKASSSLKLMKSQSSTFSSRAPSTSGRSTSLSSIPSKTSRLNMSFSNDRLREIDRHNNILLTKILSARNKRKSSIPPTEPPKAKVTLTPTASIHRKQLQRKIDYENMILLKKIQRAKATVASTNRR